MSDQNQINELPNSVFVLVNKFSDKFNKLIVVKNTIEVDYITEQQKDLSLFLKALSILDKKEDPWHIKILKFDKKAMKITIAILVN